jgi:uncharacterized protein
MLIKRIYQNLDEWIQPNLALIIFGPRQAGKTTLLKNFLSQTNYRYRFEVGDDIRTQHILSSPDLHHLQEFIGDVELLVIDEAQNIPDIGKTLKLLVDNTANLKIIATGSSSFELAGQVGEPLTGRKKTLTLYPVSQIELKTQLSIYDLKQQLPNFLIYGSYPQILTANDFTAKRELLFELMGSYLLKDILTLDSIKNSKILLDLLRLLAFQLGKEVSHAELAQNLKIDGKTVSRYLDVLEKSFVIYNLRGFSRNLRKEITKKSKYYFYDNGIRNAIISNFNSLELRNDIGELWENFIVIERIKKQAYTSIHANNFFWRTWDQQEIDFVEEREGKLYGYEIKWKDNRTKIPKDWKANYPEAEFTVINIENYLNFIA